MTNLIVSEEIPVGGSSIWQIRSNKYQFHKIYIERDNQTWEIKRTMGSTWTRPLENLRHIFESNIGFCLKRKVLTSMHTVCTYGADSVTPKKRSANKICIAQRRMERSLTILSKDRFWSEDGVNAYRSRRHSPTRLSDHIKRMQTNGWM